jgi:hypothetical protein
VNRVALVAAVAFALSLGSSGRQQIVAQAPAGAEHFKYGSIGAEPNDGLPYWIFKALPVVCASRLGPAKYGALGIVWEKGRDLPIGFSKRAQFGGDRVSVNCAFCHTATYRATPSEPPHIVVGGPATRTSPQAYFRFLTACAASDDFSPDKVLAAINTMTSLSWTDRLLHRFALIPGTKKGLGGGGGEREA